MKKILSLGKYSMDGTLLGCGNFGRVELATHVLTNIKVAIKIIDTRKLTTVYASRNLYREAKILSQIRHPNIVRIYETMKASYLYCLVLEYISTQDLSEYLKTLPGCKMSERECWPMMRQIASALIYLHERNIVHRDLKMDNILLDDTHQNVKIIDFGLSNMFAPGQLLRTHCGSPEFAAPELFYDRHDYGPEVDAWSFGVILYGTLCGKLPFVPGSTEPSKRHALLKMLSRGLVQEHKSQMCHLSLDCRSLLLQLIEPKPELRLTMFQVVEHVWVSRDGRYPVEVNTEPPRDEPLKAKVVSKLAQLHGLDTEYIQNHVSEGKYDSISSQYNMLMDRYSQIRRVQGIPGCTYYPKQKRSPRPASSDQKTSMNNNKKLNIPTVRMRGLVNGHVKDDTILALPMGSKALLAQSLAEADKLGGDKPMITLSVCPTPKRSQNTNNPTPGPSADANRLSTSSCARSPQTLPVTSCKVPTESDTTSSKEYTKFTVKNSASVSSSMSPSQGAMTISTTSTMLTELVREDNSTPDDLAVNKWKLHENRHTLPVSTADGSGSRGSDEERSQIDEDASPSPQSSDENQLLNNQSVPGNSYDSRGGRKLLSRPKCWIKGSPTFKDSQ